MSGEFICRTLHNGQTSVRFLCIYLYQFQSVCVTKYHLCNASALFDNLSFL